jgi:carbonic anhydrase/acetyltransferase-like protein (isoleucine patch superfamily)
MDVWRGMVGCGRSCFIAAVVIGGDGFGVGSVLVLKGACTIMSKCWIGNGPSDLLKCANVGMKKGNE